MELIQTNYYGDRQQPLEKEKEFVLAKCGSTEAEQYRQCSVRGEGPLTDTYYTVFISIDEYEIHAYFRWPSAPLWSILEIIFFRETTPAQ